MITTDLGAGPSEGMNCGKHAASLVPRLGMYFPCVLDEGHKGDCAPGGTCVKHGPYVGKLDVPPQCPQWPDCITGVATQEEKMSLCPNYCDCKTCEHGVKGCDVTGCWDCGCYLL